MPSRSGKVAFVVALALLICAAPARAQDAAAAREHYQKGTSYYDLGRYQEAIKEFEAAYEIKNDPALLYNLAQSYRLAGNSEQALHFYRTYLRRVPKAPNRTEIEGRITALEQLVAQKNATQTAPPNQTIPPVTGGGTEPGPLTGTTGTTPPPPPPLGAPGSGAPLPTQPPPADAVAGGPAATLGTVPAAPGAGGRDPGHGTKLAGAAVAGVGGLLFLVGIIEGGRAAAASNEVNDAAKTGKPFDPAVESRGKSAQKAEAVLMVLGALAGAGGGLLYLYGRHTTERAAAGQVSLTPVASAQGAGALLRVTF